MTDWMPEPLINLHDWLYRHGVRIVSDLDNGDVSPERVQQLYRELEHDALERARAEVERRIALDPALRPENYLLQHHPASQL